MTSTGEADAHRYLSIYLNDHLAGATVGVALARRLADADQSDSDARQHADLARQISDDRAALKKIMHTLHVPARTYKVLAGAAFERIRLLKPHGGLLRHSPLSLLAEREMLTLGARGKLAAWLVLREHADSDARLNSALLEDLIRGAEIQIATLEELRLKASKDAFG